MRRFTLSIFALAAGAATACSDDPSAEPPEADTGVDTSDVNGGAELTWSNSTRDIAATHCVPCHIEGGAAPFALDSHEQWEIYGAASMAAIDSGSMPPWNPDPECQTFDAQRVLPSADAETLRAWIDSGAPVGDASLAVIETTPETDPFTPTHAALTPDFTPDLAQADSYRCFILDIDVPETVYMTGSRVVPGSPLVHHALVFALDGTQEATARELDALEDGPGYSCFGGPIPLGAEESDSPTDALSAFSGFPTQIGGWVPGSVYAESTIGTATRVSAGSAVVIQIHYSALAQPGPDDTATVFEMLATTDEPEFLRITAPIAVQELDIPAGESSVQQILELPYHAEAPLLIRSIAGHMHLLGTEIHAEIISDGVEDCLFDIPAWDFNWQQNYVLADDDWIQVQPGERIRTTCVFDNSAANQPVVSGEQLEPVDVGWGDGTLDEMCLLYLESVFPFEPEAAGGGDAACTTLCVDDCGAEPSVDCLLQCSGDNLACIGCTFEALSTCGGAACLVELSIDPPPCIQQCFNATVMLHGETDRCLSAECPETYSDLTACLDPLLTSPDCSEEIATCGLTW